MRTFITVLVLGAAALSTSGCTKKEASADTPPSKATSAAAVLPTTPAPAPTPEPTATATATAKGEKVEIEIATVGDTMAFDKTSLTVPTGAEVHLVLKNNGTIPAMQHNWVLVKKGTEAAVALAGLEKAPNAGYVVPGDDVLAYTPLAAPKGSAEITFTAPAPGQYAYICTFPGHYMLMKGVLTVTP